MLLGNIIIGSDIGSIFIRKNLPVYKNNGDAFLISFFYNQCSDDSWRHKMNDEILREAMFYNGVSVEIRSAGDPKESSGLQE